MLGMQQEGQSKGGRTFQRPDNHVKMLPVKLSLHDPIMWETWNATPEELKLKAQDAYNQNTSKLALTGLSSLVGQPEEAGNFCFHYDTYECYVLCSSTSSAIPTPVNLAAVDFDALIEGKVWFERELANVIALKAEFTKHPCCDKAFINVDQDSLVRFTLCTL